MNILLIGNGFDLAHGLPTKYDDFLNFVKVLIRIINTKSVKHINSFSISQCIERKLIEEFDVNRNATVAIENMNVWKSLIKNNLWFDYFFENRANMDKNWIDFEKEICFVISELDRYINDSSMYYLKRVTNFFYDRHYFVDDFLRNFKVFLETYLHKNKMYSLAKMNIDDFIFELENDLERLISALELYISNYVNTIDINEHPFDIQSMKISKVMSFNYSNTFERLYDTDDTNKIEYDYIHGKAFEQHDLNNSLVLGINEYLPDYEKNINIRFIRFKKYFQRIHKNTGSKYIDWIDEIAHIRLQIPNNLFIIGHSLDETDGDILRKLILNNDVSTTIYYHSRETYAKQIANLVKVIGQDELIKRTGGSERTICFVDQNK